MKKTVTYCDRCNKELSPSYKNNVLKIEKYGKTQKENDLCVSCVRDLDEFMAGPSR